MVCKFLRWCACLIVAVSASPVSAALTTAQQIQQLYIAYLGRAADPAGLEYWTSEVDSGLITIEQLRKNLVNEQPEYQENYGQLSNSDLVVAVYRGLFNREPDEPGRLYWEEQLTNGAFLPDQLIVAFINGAAPEDQQIVANKLTAAECYTNNPDLYSPDLVTSIITELDNTAAYEQCPPVADAGEDQTVSSGQLVQLNGAGTDLESGVTFTWSQILGTSIDFSDPTVGNASFTAPAISEGANDVLRLMLTVTDNAGATGTDTLDITVAGATSEAFSFYRENISAQIIQGRCIACHVPGGLAQSTELRYTRSTVDGYQQTNFDLLSDYIDSGGGTTILNKALGVGHGGGTQLSSSSTEYADLETFIGLITGVDSGGSQISSAFFDGVTMADATKTFRRAATILGGRLPTDEEKSQLATDGDSALPDLLLQLMEGKGFHEFLIEGANDRLLTDKFIDAWADVYDDSYGFYPDMVNILYELRISGQSEEAWQEHWRGKFGMARAPLELIAFIVENDFPYTEVLTADYLMFNPYSNSHLRGGAEFDDGSDINEFQPGIIQGQLRWDDTLEYEYSEEFRGHYLGGGLSTNYPHAGILNSPAFLARYPSTETNRNRARSRWTYYHFLGVDIEKSASRTTDPEALADTDNPTMNNPNCTVCHEVMDPVAGAFQNYGNEGWYRSSYFGMDSLPDSYKWESDSDYQWGDTWYRDMRIPGMGDDYAPSNLNSIQWLAQEIVADPRFATATVKFWWLAVMGVDVLSPPEDETDINYAAQLAAYEAQQEEINRLAGLFSADFSLKHLLVEMVMSEWFRADSAVDLSEQRQLELADAGIERLLTPEQLQRKTKAIAGYTWGRYYDDFTDREIGALTDRYNLYLGGIDSIGVVERSTAANALMTQTSLTHALASACGIVLMDMERPDGERYLFNAYDRRVSPTSQYLENISVEGEGYEQRQDYTVSTELEAGDWQLLLAFTNDYYLQGVGDRNLMLGDVRIYNSGNALVAQFNLAELDDIPGANASGGDSFWRDGYWSFWSAGLLTVPISIPTAGNYRIVISAFGDQAGPESANMLVSLNSGDISQETMAGLAVKQRIAELHERFLAEELSLSDPEIEATYQLYMQTWQDFNARDVERWITYEDTECNAYELDWGDVDWSDPSHNLKTWAVVIAYLMSDYKFLHE